MAKLEEGQTVEYWYNKAEMYRRQLGGVNAANSKMKHKLRMKEKRIAELERLLRTGYSFVAQIAYTYPDDVSGALAWCTSVETIMEGETR